MTSRTSIRSSRATSCLMAAALFFGSLSISGCAVQREVWDPAEPVNRKIHWFNERVDQNVLEPVARGYDYVFPSFVKRGIGNFFRNLGTPSYLVSDLVQLKFEQAGDHTARFLLNTTVGIVGLVDVAKEMGIQHHEEDFGTALGYYDIGPGPYIVLPILGPSNGRDLIGRVVDSFLDPVSYIPDFWVQAGLRATNGIETRRRLIDAIDAGRESSLDFYTFIQSSHNQSRLNLIYDGKVPAELLPPEEEETTGSAEEEGWTEVAPDSSTNSVDGAPANFKATNTNPKTGTQTINLNSPTAEEAGEQK
ncbi:MAG: VacJ family lipoprotein [Deltaproteobacteria bacterium]|nr:VacJ family lipoprotein [Deltaproteobacteria bacterium]